MSEKARTFVAVAQDGKLHLTAPVAYRQHCEQYGDGEEVEITVRLKRQRRSSQANRYWWGVVMRVAAESLGYADPDDLHEAVCYKFRPLPNDPLTGAPMRTRTSKMTKDEFRAFTDDVIQWLETDLGIRVPRPDEIEDAA
jgi:hypothetical protein